MLPELPDPPLGPQVRHVHVDCSGAREAVNKLRREGAPKDVVVRLVSDFAAKEGARLGLRLGEAQQIAGCALAEVAPTLKDTATINATVRSLWKGTT